MSAPALSAPLRRLLGLPGVAALSGASLGPFVAHGVSALFFTGNSARYPEIDDLAVVLPELMKAFPGVFRLGVVDPDQERELAVRFKVTVRPTLVFLRDGTVLGSLPRMRDWAVYLDGIAALLATEPV
ncbi:hydrogenase [Acidocella sp.]|uniref:hydrogenase n=1 Tax=Acidocella sp. TaxID=50710 RepID=UPI003D053A6C